MMYVFMYVCKEVALRGDAHGILTFQLGQGEGPIGLVGPICQPRGTIDTASLTLGHTNIGTVSEPTLL